MSLSKKITVDAVSFAPRLSFYKDGEQFCSFPMELLQDLTFIAPKDFPFKGPELSAKDAFETLFEMIKNELKDDSLDNELRELMKAKFLKEDVPTEP